MSRTLLMLKPVPLVSFLPGGGGTFTRASEASYYTGPPNTTGNFLAWQTSNVIRADAKIVGAPYAYLLEPTRANICRYSEDLNHATWIKTLCSINAGFVQAPDPDVDCCVVSFTADATATCLQTVASSLDANTYATSVWVRKASAGNVRISYLLRDGTTAITADKAVSTLWTRIEDIRSWGTGATPPTVALQNDAAGTAQDIEVWGWAVERITGTNPIPSSNIRTVASQVTRSADSLTFAAIPEQIRTGRWSYRCAPEFADTESTITTAAFGMEAAADSYVGIAGAGANAVASAVIKYTKAGLTYARDQLMTITPDGVAKTMTVSGALAGDGTGAVGALTSWGAGYLRVGAIFNGARAWQGRIWEPYAA